jgi:hypothetical protein
MASHDGFGVVDLQCRPTPGRLPNISGFHLVGEVPGAPVRS